MGTEKIDKTVIIVTLLLVSIGVVMVYSASAVLAVRHYGDSFYFFKRQLVWAAMGVLTLMIFAMIPFSVWHRFSTPIFLLTCGLLLIVLIPSMGMEANGSRRWLKLGGFSFQPSEAAKLAIVFYLARYLSRKGSQLQDFFHGFSPPVVMVGVVLLLVMAEPDLGTAVLIGVVGGCLLFVGGARWRHLLTLAVLLIPVVAGLILGTGYRRQRLMAFLDPWNHQADGGFQAVQSFLALGGGGPLGTGLGEGRQKLFFLPEPHTDFIFSVLGEELGFLGAAAVLILFLILISRGLMISIRANQPFGYYLGLGISLMLGIQVMLNIGVVTGLLPTKGLTLPFLSYGGSSLVTSLAEVGILLNVSRNREAMRRG
ncbi:MAG TPA: putative lipid II flippase FtsW [Nitrospiria bacterium]|jgi:cell division protein FtsW|nr:putative lipid II flippase FtsW [Nitrospiria bacterium]